MKGFLGECPGPLADMRMISHSDVPMRVPLHIESFLGVQVDASHQFGLKRGLLWCWRCGLFSATVVKGLSKACKRRPTSGSTQVLERLKRGLTPTPQVEWPLPEPVDLHGEGCSSTQAGPVAAKPGAASAAQVGPLDDPDLSFSEPESLIDI